MTSRSSRALGRRRRPAARPRRQGGARPSRPPRRRLRAVVRPAHGRARRPRAPALYFHARDRLHGRASRSTPSDALARDAPRCSSSTGTAACPLCSSSTRSSSPPTTPSACSPPCGRRRTPWRLAASGGSARGETCPSAGGQRGAQRVARHVQLEATAKRAPALSLRRPRSLLGRHSSPPGRLDAAGPQRPPPRALPIHRGAAHLGATFLSHACTSASCRRRRRRRRCASPRVHLLRHRAASTRRRPPRARSSPSPPPFASHASSRARRARA